MIKRGAKGASYYHANQELHVKSNTVEMIDPTSAGDCFGATFISLFLAGYSVEQALKYANASGALAVSRLGPMEGISSIEDISRFLAQ